MINDSFTKFGLGVVIAALILLSAPFGKAQSPMANAAFVPPMLPGDVLYVDNVTAQAYLLWHSDTKKFQVIEPYTQDQVFHLLLMREQAVWDTYYWFSRSTVVKPPMASMPGINR